MRFSVPEIRVERSRAERHQGVIQRFMTPQSGPVACIVIIYRLRTPQVAFAQHRSGLATSYASWPPRVTIFIETQYKLSYSPERAIYIIISTETVTIYYDFCLFDYILFPSSIQCQGKCYLDTMQTGSPPIHNIIKCYLKCFARTLQSLWVLGKSVKSWLEQTTKKVTVSVEMIIYIYIYIYNHVF